MSRKNNKNSFVMYLSWATMIENLPEEQAGELIKAICAKQNGHEYQIKDPVVMGVFAMIEQKMDEDAESYRETCEKRAEAGKKGNEKRWNESQTVANDRKCDNSESQTVAKIADTDTESDTDTEKDKKEKHPTGVKRNRTPFKKPTIDEVRTYCLERGNSVNAEAWMAHYESNGWKVGNSPMKDWKAAVRTWEHNNYDNRTRAKPENGTQFNNNFHQRDYDMQNLEAQLRRAQRGTA